MYKLLVLLTCLTFPIPSPCCEAEQVCCPHLEIQVVSCCTDQTCDTHHSPVDSNRPCCELGGTGHLFVSPDTLNEVVQLTPVGTVAERLVLLDGCQATLCRVPRESSLRTGRSTRMRIQSWLC